MDINDVFRDSVNFMLGYMTALEGYAVTKEQRDSATEVIDMICQKLAYVPAPREREAPASH